ncbi:WD40 repeat-like protein [Imleria badia]|nr:WD40 repeat-like protein [Imleria badia]
MSTPLTTSNVGASEPITIKSNGSDFMSSVAFLAGGRHFVGGGFDGKIRRWRADTVQQMGTPMIAGGSHVQVVCLAASRDGKWIVSGTEDGSVAVWNGETLSRAFRFAPHPDYAVDAVDVSPDGTRIVTGSHDSTVCVWSFSTRERLLGPLKHDYGLAAVKYSPDGRLLATATLACGRHSVRIYNSQDTRLLIYIPIKVDGTDQSLAWSNDGNHLYALSEGNIMFLDVSTGTTLSEWPIPGNDDPRTIALARNGRFIVASAGTTLSFWDTMTEKQIGPVIEPGGVLFSTAISPNYDLVAAGIRSTVVLSLPEILPSHYCDNRPCERDPPTETENTTLEETMKLLLTEVRSLRA